MTGTDTPARLPVTVPSRLLAAGETIVLHHVLADPGRSRAPAAGFLVS